MLDTNRGQEHNSAHKLFGQKPNYKSGSKNLLSHALLPERSLTNPIYILHSQHWGMWGTEIKNKDDK